jgi:hypothetical protein
LIGTVAYGQPPLVMEPLPNPPTGVGIGFYVRGGQETVTPSQVDATDSANVMPIASAARFNDQNLSVYLIDSAAAPTTGSSPSSIRTTDRDYGVISS